MHYFLYVSLERFYVAALARSDPTRAEMPLVVFEGKVLLDANDAAERLGARVGMGLAEAKSLLRDTRFVELQPDDFKAQQERWLDVCAAFSDGIQTDGQHAAWIDLSLHADPMRSASELIEALSEWQLRSCLSTVKWVAKAIALAGPIGQLEDACKPRCAIRQLKVRHLLPVSEPSRIRLRFLGYRTIGEVSALSLARLRSQFGPEGLTIYQAVAGGFSEPLQADYPPNAVALRERFVGGATLMEELESGLARLAASLGTALEAADQQSRRLELMLESELQSRRASRTFTKPIADGRSALAALKLLFREAIEARQLEDGEAIEAVRAIARPLEPCDRRQSSLLGVPAPSRSMPTQALQSVQRLFGQQAVKVASDVVEPRRKLLLKAWKDATGWL